MIRTAARRARGSRGGWRRPCRRRRSLRRGRSPRGASWRAVERASSAWPDRRLSSRSYSDRARASSRDRACRRWSWGSGSLARGRGACLAHVPAQVALELVQAGAARPSRSGSDDRSTRPRSRSFTRARLLKDVLRARRDRIEVTLLLPVLRQHAPRSFLVALELLQAMPLLLLTEVRART